MLRDLDRWLFGRGSPVAFGVFRALIGAVAFANLLMLIPQARDWFHENGLVPSGVAKVWLGGGAIDSGLGFEVPRVNLIGGVTDPTVTLAFLWLVALAALFTSLGLFSRVATVALAVGIVSIHHRNPIILHGGDTVLRICCLYLAVGPSGAGFSLDRWLARRRGKAPEEPEPVFLWAQRCVCLNVALLYFTTVWVKWQGDLWRDGTATWYTARLAEFKRFPVPQFLNDPPMIAITTYGTLLVEFALATLVFFRPLRKWALLGGLLLHGGIEYSMNVPLFAFAICSMYVCFYDGEEVSDWWNRLQIRVGGFFKDRK